MTDRRLAESNPEISNRARWVVLAAAGLVFAVDAHLALGVTGSILYLPVIWLAFRSGQSVDVYMTAGMCSLLALADLFISPAGGEVWKVAINVTLGISAIWMTAALCSQIIRTKRKLATRDRYRSTIVEHALDAVISMDTRGCIVDWNAQAERVFGWTQAEAVGQELASLIIPPDQRDAHRAGLRHYLKTGEGPVLGQRLELTALRQDGGVFPIELSVIAVPLDRTILFNAFLRDISRRVEDAAYRMRMAALVDSSYDAIIGKEVTGKITSWNTGAERVYGYREEEAVGKTVAIILPPDVEEEEPEIRQAMQTGRRLEQFETTRRRKDGQLIAVSLTVSPIADENDTIIGFSTIERDITERKRNERELQRAKESAERANLARSEFLANVSHELRTPMNAIIGMTEIALSEEVSDEIRDYIETANESAHSLLALLNDILDFSKLESGKFTIEKEPFALREMIDETVKTLSPRAFQKGLELACDVAADAPDKLIGDSVRLRQVLTNLVSNAIKFTEQGEVVVKVETLRTWPHETQLRFSVSDTGVGISPDSQRRILKPFEQADSSSTRRHGGTGLGLSICNELLRLMGGRLSVESKPANGSCFSFKLSLARQSEPANEAEEPGSFTPLRRLHGMRVLVVDDNETNRRILTQMFSNWSMRPEAAGGGKEALAKLNQICEAGAPCPLVIVDALMPEIDGYALSQRIVEQFEDPPPVILMVSSSDRLEFKQREAEANVAVFLQKPVSHSDLMDAVMRAMNVRIPESEPDANAIAPTETPATLSVLVAEDTPANQKVVTSILSKRGHHVTIAPNGREAVEQFRGGRFDAVLMDVQMPIMDGYQATAAMRALEKDRAGSTPIIAMTAHAMHGDREKCLEAGMDAYIAKPIDVKTLVDLVESVSKRQRDFPSGASQAVSSDGEDRDETRDGARATAGFEARPLVEKNVIDFDGTLQRLAGDMDLFRDFIGYFDEDSPKLVSTLREAIAAGNAPAVQRAAHSLKGLAANFGAPACQAAAHELEERARAGALTAATEILARLEQEVVRLDRALQQYRDEI